MGTVVFSFDDGRLDNYRNVYPLLKEMDLPATFNITTGYIDKTIRGENRFCENPAMTIEHISEISSNPLFEIASHGDNHLNTIDDIRESINKLEAWKIISPNGIGFASPHHRLEQGLYSEIVHLKNELGLKYIRIGGRLRKDFYSRSCRYLYRQLRFYNIFCMAYDKCVMYDFPSDGIFLSLPYNKNISGKDIQFLIDEKIANDTENILVLLFHSVIKRGEKFYDNLENIDYDEFERICFKLKGLKEDNKIKIERNIDLVR